MCLRFSGLTPRLTQCHSFSPDNEEWGLVLPRAGGTPHVFFLSLLLLESASWTALLMLDSRDSLALIHTHSICVAGVLSALDDLLLPKVKGRRSVMEPKFV